MWDPPLHPQNPIRALSVPFAQRREKTSIHRLMESFLLGLQADFPSTISTVYRYGTLGWGHTHTHRQGAPPHPFCMATGQERS